MSTVIYILHPFLFSDDYSQKSFKLDKTNKESKNNVLVYNRMGKRDFR